MDSAAGKFLLAIGLCLILGILELRFPAHERQSLSGRLRNLVLTAITLALGAAATRLLFYLLPARFDPPPIGRGIRFSIATALVYALATDFMFYWYHRAEHRFPFLWAIHQLHHSDAELNATTSMRNYWLETPLQALVIGIPVGYAIGLDPLAAALSSFGLMVWFFFAHANWKLRLGLLTPILCGPQVHRIHHSTLPQHRDHNFAQYFPFIDLLFGTYYAPAPDDFPPTGTPELASDASLATVMVRPFRLWGASLGNLVRG